MAVANVKNIQNPVVFPVCRKFRGSTLVVLFTDYRSGVVLGVVWNNCFPSPSFDVRYKYRRKTKMLSVTLANGEVVSWPEPLKLQNLELRKQYFFIDADFVIHETMWIKSCDTNLIVCGMVHLTEEAAEQHAAALRKINTQGF